MTSRNGTRLAVDLKAARRHLGSDILERIAEPTESACGLPNEAFTSAEFLELENRLLFRRTWMCAGFVHELGAPGSIRPVEVAGVPILLARDAGGEIRAFHNVCRHRGTQLLAEPRTGVQQISCPYHGWTYALDGRLKRRAHFDGPQRDGDCDGIALFAIRTNVWANLIFINVDGEAPALDTFLAPLERELAGYDFSTLCYAGERTWEIECNWKFVFENYVETYHLPWCHPAAEKSIPSAKHWFSCDGPCLVSRADFDVPEEGRGAGLPLLPNMPAELERRGTSVHLFPSCCINIYPDQVLVFLVTPLGPDRCFERIVFFFPAAAMVPEYERGRRKVFEVMEMVNNEDIDIVEGQQRGRAAPAFDGGILSPYWDGPTTHQFVRQVVEGMTRA